MSRPTLLDLSGPALQEALRALAAGGPAAAGLGAALDAVPAAAFSLGLQGLGPASRDHIVAAAFLLAATRTSRFVVAANPARQHPIHVARAVATLSALHGGRIGVAAQAQAPARPWYLRETHAALPDAADYLRLLASLWDSWPLDAVAADAASGPYADASRIVRIADPAYPAIGGPLTLPTDTAARPPTVLLAPAGTPLPEGVDLVLEPPRGAGSLRVCLGLALPQVLDWRDDAAGLGAVLDAASAAAGPSPVRRALRLGPGTPVARQGEPVFRDTAAGQVA